MKTHTQIIPAVLLAALGSCLVAHADETKSAAGPQYTKEGQLRFPAGYREWIYLSTGFNMSYNPAMRMGHDMFDNVFVNREAYQAFVKTGIWPDKTMLVMEVRGAVSHGSINKKGSYQEVPLMGMEVHVKDTSRFANQWAFFGFSGKQPATMIPTAVDCYSCHAQHGAVDTTFVQFYPTLLPIAKAKGTFSTSSELSFR